MIGEIILLLRGVLQRGETFQDDLLVGIDVFLNVEGFCFAV